MRLYHTFGNYLRTDRTNFEKGLKLFKRHEICEFGSKQDHFWAFCGYWNLQKKNVFLISPLDFLGILDHPSLYYTSAIFSYCHFVFVFLYLTWCSPLHFANLSIVLIILVVLYSWLSTFRSIFWWGWLYNCVRQLVDLVDVAAARQGVQKPVVRSRQGGANSRWSFNEKW